MIRAASKYATQDQCLPLEYTIQIAPYPGGGGTHGESCQQRLFDDLPAPLALLLNVATEAGHGKREVKRADPGENVQKTEQTDGEQAYGADDTAYTVLLRYLVLAPCALRED